MDDRCPACGAAPAYVGMDRRRHAECVAGHRWHRCAVHGRPAEGEAVGKPLTDCTCRVQANELAA